MTDAQIVELIEAQEDRTEHLKREHPTLFSGAPVGGSGDAAAGLKATLERGGFPSWPEYRGIVGQVPGFDEAAGRRRYEFQRAEWEKRKKGG